MMEERECPGLGPEQEEGLKLAAEETCELCHGYFAPAFLTIHRISRRTYREMRRDPAARVLVLCHDCHRHVHALPLLMKEQRKIVARRSFYTRQEMRRVLGYRPPAYRAPEVDVAQVYAEYFNYAPPGSYRLGG